ncbi:vitamin K epoxide reductase family protein [Archangium lipolyticum]|uniref:vitamin K epoxide reductase family protein n=1 Tax=Archangium lipolyticum TaxID=2970465 RepID=UPI0027D45070|nr:vitamin K epoxide reductase family protein [Archangium lipolyticum]
MLRAPGVPSDGPAEVLAEAARRLGLRYSRTHVRQVLGHHERPGSLLALVQGASSLGLKATAGQGDLETLDELDADELPALLHFQSGARTGFGLLEAVSPPTAGAPGSFRIWDSIQGSREVERDTLATLWSGVVVFLERSGAGDPEPGYLRHRAREWLLEEWKPGTSLAGPSASPWMRVGLATLLGVLLVLAVLAQPAGLRLPTAGLAVLSGVGLVAALAALSWTRGGKASLLCGSGGPIDCESVLLSEWARPAGVPLAGLGTAWFGALLLLLCTTALGGGPAPAWLVGAAFLPTLPLSALLVVAQVRMRRFCTLCMVVHTVDFTGAALFLFGMWPARPVPPPGWLPATLLLLLFLGLLLSSTVPHLSTGEEDAHRLREHARLLDSPLATLARLSMEPRLPLEGASLGPRLGEADAPHVLVVLAHPACGHCGPVLEEVEALVARHGEQVRVHLALAPMDPDDPRDEAACEALAAAGVAWGGPVFLQLFRAAKQDYARLRRAGEPLALVAAYAERDSAELEDVRDTARARVRAAAELKRRHARGLPSLFLDGHPCEAPLAHVATWLDQSAVLELLTPPAVRAGSTQEGAPAP